MFRINCNSIALCCLISLTVIRGGSNRAAETTRFLKDQGRSLCSGNRVIAFIVENNSFFLFFCQKVLEFNSDKDEGSVVLVEKHL